ncbi:hypothetical protein A3F37_03910 [Candidatus Saccharibacteria bacterium RIFCSPHIGHO2_12_FULL_41_12]|nr:MAG: hypothetical protein A3F37_03910 [Candidatus Saccharibacteria bacterium RIFCSPHIGHO2_12_FULL_41_12]
MKRRVKHVILNHNEYLHYSVATNVVLAILVVFLGTYALDTGAMIWWFAWIISIYYWLGITMPALWRLTHRHIKKRSKNNEEKHNNS